MADIVILYRSYDRARVQEIVDWLKDTSWSVWWDQDQAEGGWTRGVERQIRDCRCVLPIWSDAAVGDGSNVTDEVDYAKKLGKPRIHARLDEVLKPVLVSTEIESDLFQDDGYDNLSSRLYMILGNDQKLSLPEILRPSTLIIGSKEYALPVFVRSVSSFETMANPVDAMVALEIHPSSAPVLVSAFDFHDKSKVGDTLRRNQILKSLNDRGCMTFLDSGNYEAYRLKFGADQNVGKPQIDKWCDDDFYSTLGG